MTNFPPDTNVLTTIQLTRCLYAQVKKRNFKQFFFKHQKKKKKKKKKLLSQQFYPPKPFSLPPVSAPNHLSAVLGMKIACGFEILYSDKKSYSSNFESIEVIS